MSNSLQNSKRVDGILFIVSAPSGAGKTTLCRAAQKNLGGIEFSISHTTRKPREGEVHGRDYYFVSEKEFRAMIASGTFAEWAEVHGNMYGTSIEELQRVKSTGQDLLVEIDVQGAENLRKSFSDAVYIFVLPPSLEILENRLRGRGTDAEESVQRRLTIALKEIQEQDKYDYIVVNDDFDDALDEFQSVVRAERVATKRFV